MLTKRLGSILRKSFTKHLSTVPSPKVENETFEETVNTKENEILQSPDYFKVHNLFTVKDLFDARVHYGHKVSSLTSNMKPFVFGSRLDHVIFDLDITAYHLREALNFAAHIAFRDGIILFVSKNPRMTLLVERTAQNCKEYAVTREWIIGTLTDSVNKFKTSIRLPDLIIMLNTLEENGFPHWAIVEAAKMCIPVIAVVDSNCDPNLITYPIPGNDDSYSCFKLYCNLFEKAILRGKSEREKMLNEAEGSKESAETVVNPATDSTSNVTQKEMAVKGSSDKENKESFETMTKSLETENKKSLETVVDSKV